MWFVRWTGLIKQHLQHVIGNLYKHTFFAVKTENNVELPALTEDAVPILRALCHPEQAANEFRAMNDPPNFELRLDDTVFRFAIPLARKILSLCDGKHTIAQIRDALQRSCNVTNSTTCTSSDTLLK